jgi:hypothetical protein
VSAVTHAGGCRCGGVRFIANGEPLLVVNCHCADCRRATGAAFATFVDYARDAVRFIAAPTRYRSSPGAERLFCGACGSPIAFLGDSSPSEINLHLGAFDDPHAFAPGQSVRAQDALEWAINKGQ